MKVICKSNEFIAIPTRKKSECLFMLGQYLNKETCKVELHDDEIRSIMCVKSPDKSSWSTTISLQAELHYRDRYIILDKDGNLVNVVTEEQFNDQYAILQDNT